MLVYKRKDLPDDPVFPADLEELGLFINDQDQIKQIANPNEGFRYKINANERWNEVRGNAFNECIRQIVLSRLEDLGMSVLRLPVGSQVHEKHAPILHSANLSTARRIIVVFGSPDQELGIWTFRSVAEKGINAGSMVNFVQAVLEKSDDTALVIANTGQLVYHCGSGMVMSQKTWLAVPLESAAHPPLKQTYRNFVPRNANWREHVGCIFEDVLSSKGKLVNANAKIDIIGVEEGGLGAVEYLKEHWDTWNQSVSAMCLTRPLHNKCQLGVEDQESDQSPGSFARFLATRCRAYLLSDKPLEWPVPGTPVYGCNTHSSGEALYHEHAIVSSWENMLGWLDKLYDDAAHEEVEFIIEEAVDEEGWKKWSQRVDEIHEAEGTDQSTSSNSKA